MVPPPPGAKDTRRGSSSARPLSPPTWRNPFGGQANKSHRGPGAQQPSDPPVVEDPLATPRRSRTFSSPTKPTVRREGDYSETASNLWLSGARSSALPSNEDDSFVTASSPPLMIPPSRKQRGGILTAASDAAHHFGRHFAKKRPSKQPGDQAAPPPTGTHTPSILQKNKSRAKDKWALQPPPSKLLPGVIEITAANSLSVARHDGDTEQKERERLREAAAHSIGIAPLIRDDTSVRTDTASFNDYSYTLEDDPGAPPAPTAEEPGNENRESNDGHRPRGRTATLLGSVKANAGSQIQRLQSVAKHTRRSSLTMSSAVSSSLPSSPYRDRFGSIAAQLPPFPCAYGAISSYEQLSSTVPKYYPSSPLLLFSLSRQWRVRFMVMTVLPRVPPKITSGTTRPYNAAAEAIPPWIHLHLFKSAGEGELEVERLEINDKSVVYVSEEEIAARKSVVKVGGIDAGTHRKDMNPEEEGLTMWHLQIVDSADAQKWITAVKNAVLDQRSEKAGYGVPTHPSNFIEPRGDMDVMLSMRAPGFSSSPIQSPPSKSTRRTAAGKVESINPRDFASNPSPSPTVRSRQQESQQSSQSNGPPSLKGLFNNVAVRPRSPSQTSTMTFFREERDSLDGPSVLGNGNNLMALIRSGAVSPPNANGAKPVSISDFRNDRVNAIASPVPSVPSSPRSTLRDFGLTRPIMTGDEYDGVSVATKGGVTPLSMQFQMQPLQPPPRKLRRPSTAPESPSSSTGPETSFQASSSSPMQMPSLRGDDNDPDNRSNEGGLGYSPASSFGPPSGVFGTPEHKPKRSSIASSISSFASAVIKREPSLGTSSTASNHTRPSRNGKLPKMLSPPTVPPPAIPTTNGADNHELPWTSKSSNPPSMSSANCSPRSVNSLLHTPLQSSKRLSASSALSANSGNTNHSRPLQSSRIGQSPNTRVLQRASMPPPPRPAPTFALPPTPVNNLTTEEKESTANAKGGTTKKSALRAALQNRSLRLSLPPPPHQPLASPVAADSRKHRRSTSIGSTNSQSSPLFTIPASPVPSKPPAPPPTGPLPPTPQEPAAVNRMKQRLRLRSIGSRSPASSVPTSASSAAARSPERSEHPNHSSPVPLQAPVNKLTTNFLHMTNDTPSPASSTFQDSPNFLNLSSPSPIQTLGRDHRYSSYQEDDSPDSVTVTSLSPPPRRDNYISIMPNALAGCSSTSIMDGAPVTYDDDDDKRIPHRDSAVSLALFNAEID